jgi:hypothetical protein
MDVIVCSDVLLCCSYTPVFGVWHISLFLHLKRAPLLLASRCFNPECQRPHDDFIPGSSRTLSYLSRRPTISFFFQCHPSSHRAIRPCYATITSVTAICRPATVRSSTSYSIVSIVSIRATPKVPISQLSRGLCNEEERRRPGPKAMVVRPRCASSLMCCHDVQSCI